MGKLSDALVNATARLDAFTAAANKASAARFDARQYNIDESDLPPYLQQDRSELPPYLQQIDDINFSRMAAKDKIKSGD